MSPTPLAATLALVAALSALLLPVGMAGGLMIVVLTAAAVDAWLVRKPPRVRRHLPSVVSRGVPTSIQIEALAPTSPLLRQPASSYLRVEPQEGRGQLVTTITALRRGRHRLPGVATRTVGPLGLGAWYHRGREEAELVVYPDLPAASRLAERVRTGRFAGEGRRRRGPLGLGTELESVRDYQPDDDIRRLNWRATARLGRPMSNQYRVEQDREVVCLLDTGRLMAAPIGDRTRLDVAVDAVTAVAAVTQVLGDRVGITAFDERVRRRVSPRRDGARAVVEAIFDLEPAPADSAYEAAFRTAVGSKRAFVLILTDLLDESAARPLLEAVPVLARHHAVAVAGVTDPGLARRLVTTPATLQDAAEVAVATELLDEVRRVENELARLGATVVRSPADDLPTRCVDAYLRAKRAARL